RDLAPQSDPAMPGRGPVRAQRSPLAGRAKSAARRAGRGDRVAAQLDFHAHELREIDTDLGKVALDRPEVLRLMTVPGIDATVALSIVAAVGDFTRFRTPEKLVAYLGL